MKQRELPQPAILDMPDQSTIAEEEAAAIHPLREMKKLCKKLGINSARLNMAEMAAAINRHYNEQGEVASGSEDDSESEASRVERVEGPRDSPAF